MTPLPETIDRLWSVIEPHMRGGAVLRLDAIQGLWYVDGRWGGLADHHVQRLERRGLLHRVGLSYVLASEPAARPALHVSYPAITVWQPWATLVAEGCKPWEFRSYRAPAKHVGRRVAIHAGARAVDRRDIQALLLKLRRGALETGLHRERSIELLERVLPSLGLLPRKAVVCTAVLGEPLAGAALAEALGLPGYLVNDSDRMQHSNWGWPLTQVERIEPPAPATGKQGWWTWQNRPDDCPQDHPPA